MQILKIAHAYLCCVILEHVDVVDYFVIVKCNVLLHLLLYLTIFSDSAIFLKFSILQVFYSTILFLISRVSFVYSFVCADYCES